MSTESEARDPDAQFCPNRRLQFEARTHGNGFACIATAEGIEHNITRVGQKSNDEIEA